MSSLFLSHSSEDNDTALKLGEKLSAWGYRAIFLNVHRKKGLKSGVDWERELYSKLRQCEAVIVLCSEASMQSKWCFAEITQARALDKPVFPVIISPCKMVDILQPIQVTDISADSEEGLNRLCEGLRERGLDPESSFDRPADWTPFPGLRPFEPKDAWAYFGRKHDVAMLRDLLSRMRRPGHKKMAVAIGASGCGKSSLVRAGLIPKLSRSPDEWVIVPPFRPGARPIVALAGALAGALKACGQPRDWRNIRDEFQSEIAAKDSGVSALLDLATDLRMACGSAEASVLLVVDQLEEILGYVSDDIRRFIDLLRNIIEYPDSGVLIVATLRSDFLATFQLLDGLQGVEFEDFLVNPLPVNRFAEVIEVPSRRAGLKEPEAGLVDALIRDAGTKDALPLLAFTLKRLYEECRSGERLTMEAYEKIGGVQGAVENVAGDALGCDELTGKSEEIRALRRAFIRLVSVEENNRLVRREAHWDELPDAAEPMLERLVNSRLLISRGGGAERVVEVAHESLFRVWNWLASWLEDCIDFLQWRRRLHLAMAESERLPDDPSVLLQGARLVQGQRWLEEFGDTLTDAEAGFVEQSRFAAEERERERERFEKQKRSTYFNHITLAQRLLDENQFEMAQDNLESCDPDFRHWEWHHLARQCGGEFGAFSAKGSLTTDAVDAASMDGSVWAVAAKDRGSFLEEKYDIFVQALPSGEEVLSVSGVPGSPRALALSPNGRFLAAIDSIREAESWKWTLSVWDTGSSKRVWCAERSPLQLVAMRFESETVLLLATTDGGERRIDLVHSEESVTAPPQGATPIPEAYRYKFVLSPDARWLAGSCQETYPQRAFIVLWNWPGLEEVHRFSTDTKAVGDVAFSPDSELVAAACNDRVKDGSASEAVPAEQCIVRIWHTSRGQALQRLVGHDDEVLAIAFSPCRSRLATGGHDRTVRVWSTSDGVELTRLRGHRKAVRSIAYFDGGRRLVSRDDDGAFKVWDPRRSAACRVLHGHQGPVYGVGFSSDGRQVASGGGDLKVRIWDAKTGDQIRVIQSFLTWVMDVAFSPDGRYLAEANADYALVLWDLETDDHPSKVSCAHNRAVAFSSCGRYLASASSNAVVVVDRDEFSADQYYRGKRLEGHTDQLMAVAFSPDDRLIASGGKDRTARVWEQATGDVLCILEHEEPVWDVAFAPDGAALATASGSSAVFSRAHKLRSEVTVWSIPGGNRMATLKGHTSGVTGVAFSRDGERVFSASQDGTVKVWDRTSGQEILTLRGHFSACHGLAISPDGHLLASCGLDRTVRVWDGRPQAK